MCVALLLLVIAWVAGLGIGGRSVVVVMVGMQLIGLFVLLRRKSNKWASSSGSVIFEVAMRVRSGMSLSRGLKEGCIRQKTARNRPMGASIIQSMNGQC